MQRNIIENQTVVAAFAELSAELELARCLNAPPAEVLEPI